MWEQGDRKTEHSVSTHLQHDTCQHHRTARWCLNVCIRKPCVERCCWKFHKETKHEHNEQNLLDFKSKPDTARIRTARLNNHFLHVEGLRIHEEVHRQQSKQHDDRCGECVDEELLSSILSIFSTPLENQEEHRNEGQFPEDVEHEHIKCDKDANQCATKHQHEWEVRSTRFLVPCCNDGDWHQQRC